MWRCSFAKEPLEPFRSAARLRLSLFLVLLLGFEVSILAEEPVEGFTWWGFRGVRYPFSSSSIRAPACHRLPMSGGLDDMKHPVEVTAKPPLVPASFYKLDEAKLLQKVQVALDG